MFSFFLLFVTIGVWGQLENANWYFGNHAGLNFESGVVALTDGQTDNEYKSSTTVSDNEGNLLFYSVGNDVWNRNHELMSECGSYIFAETQIIVPYPGDSNKYYIFSANDTDGYFYSIVNMSLNNGLGNVEVFNVSLNIPVPENWWRAERMLVSKHDDGESYWLITQPDYNYYAVRVSDNGVSSTPVISTNNCTGFAETPLSISADETLISSIMYDVTIGSGKGEKEGTAIYFLSILNFDNATGMISCFVDENNQIIDIRNQPKGWWDYPVVECQSVEFSENNRFIYVLKKGDVNNEKKIIQYDLDNISTNYAIEIANVVGAYNGIDPKATMRRAIDNKIYISTLYGDDYISVINNPNILGTACNFNKNQVNLLGKLAKKLPYLVPISFCVPTLNISTAILSGETDFQSAKNTITATNTIFNGATAEYDAGNIVYLKPNFHAKEDSNFRAFIEGCGNNDIKPKKENIEIASLNKGWETKDNLNKVKHLKLYPNPTRGFVYLESNDDMLSWELSNQYGKTQGYAILDDKKSHKTTINTNNLPTGIYFLKIVFKDGEVLMKTLIKE